MAVPLPLVLLILDWYPFQRLNNMRSARRALLEKLPFIVISVVSSIMILVAQNKFGAVAGLETFPFEARALVAVQSLMLYLRNMICPLRLSPFYPYPLQQEIAFFSVHILLSIFFIIGITVFALLNANKRGLWLATWAYYVVTLLPVIGIIQVGRQSMADRYIYLPSLSPFLIVGLGTAWIWMKINPSKCDRLIKVFAVSLAIALFIGLSSMTLKQIAVWKNSIELWSSVIEKEPDRAPFAYFNRAVAFKESGQASRAILDYTRAIALDPAYDSAYLNRGIIFMELGQPNQAIEDYTSAITLNRSFYLAYNNRGVAYKKMGKLDRAIEDYNAAIALEPDHADAYINRGIAFNQKGQMSRAIEDYNRAITLKPFFYVVYINRGVTYKSLGQVNRAIEDYTVALSLNSNYLTGYIDRGDLYLKTGEKQLALKDYQTACTLGNQAGCNMASSIAKTGM
jgi:tetratricopeptide (TPR) repeat protein